MKYKPGQRYQVSDKVKDYLASRSIDFLADKKQFFNYTNKFDILEGAVEKGYATNAHKTYADKLLSNVKKMNKKQRSRVEGGYETLLDRAQKLNEVLAEKKEAQSPLEAHVQKQVRRVEYGYDQIKERAEHGELPLNNKNIAAFNKLRASAYRLGDKDLSTRISALAFSVADYEGSVKRAEKLSEIVCGNYTLGQKVNALSIRKDEETLGKLLVGEGNALKKLARNVYARNDSDLIRKLERTVGKGLKPRGLYGALKLTAASTLLVLGLSCGGDGSDDNKKETEDNKSVPEEIAKDPNSPVEKTGKTDAVPPKREEKEEKTPDGKGPGPDPKQDPEKDVPQEEQNVPIPGTDSPTLSDDIGDVVRFLAKAEVMGSKNFTGYALNEKVLFNLGDGLGVSLYGQQRWQTQEFDNGDLDGTIHREGIGLYKYFELNEQEQIYLEAAAIFEDRDFDFDSKTGSDFDFGNDARNIVAKVGYVNMGDFSDDSAFDPSFTKMLLTLSYGSGDMDGDIDGSYRNIRATFQGHQRLDEDVALTFGLGWQREQLGDDWRNRIFSAEGGLRFDILDGKGILALKGTYRDLSSTMNGIHSDSQHFGVKGSFGYKPEDWIEFGIDLGYEWDDGDREGLGGYVLPGIKINLGGKRRK